MATASSVIGTMQVNITAATHGLDSALKRARKLTGGFVADVKSSLVGALAALPFASALKSFESAGSALHDLSTATGIAVENLSFLKYAADQSGTSLEVLTKAARELQLKGIDPNQFEQIAKKIADIKDPTMRAQSAFYYFGKKAGFAILPLLKDLPELKKRFGQLGGGFTSKMASAADALGDSWGDLKFALANIGNAIAYELAPYVTDLTIYISDNGKAIVQWVKDNKKLVLGLSAASFVIAILIPVLFTLKTFFGLVSTAVWGCNVALAFLVKNPTVAGLLAIGAAAAYMGQQFTTATYSVGALVLGLGILLRDMKMVAAGGVIIGSAYAGQKLGQMATPTPGTTGDTGEVAKNTADMNSKMEELISIMKQMPGGQPEKTPIAPVVITGAGVR